MKLTAHLHLLPRLGVSGARPLLPLYTFMAFTRETLPFYVQAVAYPGILFRGGGGSTNSVEDRGQTERGYGGGSPLDRGSGGSCNLYKKFHFI